MATILVVEDDPSMRNVLAGTLEDAGHDVIRAESGHEAVELAQQGQEFDLVVTDVRMTGIDGITAFEELRKLKPHVRGIVITGYAGTDAPMRALRAGVWDYLHKPFGLQDLLTAVERILNAEEEDEKRNSLLGTWWAGARNWLKRRLSNTGEKARHRAYWGFHAGIRSKLLDSAAALAVWDELDKAEQLYQQGREADELFSPVLRLIAELQREQVILYWEAPRQSSQVTKAEFEAFFKRVLHGEIPGHLLPLAPLLRYVDKATAPPEVRRLAITVWGE